MTKRNLFGVPVDMEEMGMPSGLLSQLLGDLLGMEVESTIVLVGQDGSVKTKTVGSRMEDVDISSFDPEIIKGIKEAANFKFAIRDKQERASNLRREAATLERQVRQSQVRLKHSIWNQVDNRYYGDDHIEIGREGDAVQLKRNGHQLCVIEGEVGQQLMSQHEEIAAMRSSINDKSNEADQLERECHHQPELARVMQEQAIEALFNYLKSADPELRERLLSGRAYVGINGEGEVGIRARVEIDEESEELPAEVRDLMAVMEKYHPSGHSLPPAVAKLFGINPTESDKPTRVKDVVPPGTFMAGTNGNGHHHEGECPATSEPVMVAAGNVPLDEPDGGKLGD